jgi:predicted negative regulator of RcsB-dependent stress response
MNKRRLPGIRLLPQYWTISFSPVRHFVAAAELRINEVDELLTDEQQADRARQWVRENGVFIVAGVVLGLGGLFGWQQWTDYNEQRAGRASVVWEQLRSAIDGERYNEVDETFALLEQEYPSTPYLDQARLALAAMHMDRNSPDEALEQLQTLVRVGSDPQLRHVAEYRAAQIMLYQADYDGALKTLGENKSAAFAGLYHDLRGDIYFAMGRLEDAANEYSLALQLDSAGSIDRSFVQIKFDDVSGSLAVTAADDGADAAPVDVDQVVAPAD